MPHLTFRSGRNRGLTLIEVMIYTAMLSFLMTGFIQFAYGINSADFGVMDEINTRN